MASPGRIEAGAEEYAPRRPGENPRFLALHREPMAYGLPLGVAVTVAPLGLIGFMLTRNPVFGALLFVAVLAVLRALTAHDPNFVRVFGLWFDTRLEVRNAKTWGGASLSPLPLTRPLNPRQVPLDV